jgi:class 3 adenylate cyclase
LQGESRGGDVVLSEALAGLAGAGELLGPHAPRAETARLRGFSAPVPFVRLAVGGDGG